MPVLARTEVDKNNRTAVPGEVRKLLELDAAAPLGGSTRRATYARKAGG